MDFWLSFKIGLSGSPWSTYLMRANAENARVLSGPLLCPFILLHSFVLHAWTLWILEFETPVLSHFYNVYIVLISNNPVVSKNTCNPPSSVWLQSLKCFHYLSHLTTYRSMLDFERKGGLCYHLTEASISLRAVRRGGIHIEVRMFGFFSHIFINFFVVILPLWL